jgi:hypothetical protein
MTRRKERFPGRRHLNEGVAHAQGLQHALGYQGFVI